MVESPPPGLQPRTEGDPGAACRATESLVTTVRTALDAALAAHGFAGGQGGSDIQETQVQVLFCCPEDEFRARYRHVLPDCHEPGPWGCVDLVVDLDRTAAPRVTEVRLEAEPLPALLARHGHLAAADEARHLPELPARQALARLPGLLLRVLDDDAVPPPPASVL